MCTSLSSTAPGSNSFAVTNISQVTPHVNLQRIEKKIAWDLHSRCRLLSSDFNHKRNGPIIFFFNFPIPSFMKIRSAVPEFSHIQTDRRMGEKSNNRSARTGTHMKDVSFANNIVTDFRGISESTANISLPIINLLIFMTRTRQEQ